MINTINVLQSHTVIQNQTQSYHCNLTEKVLQVLYFNSNTKSNKLTQIDSPTVNCKQYTKYKRKIQMNF